MEVIKEKSSNFLVFTSAGNNNNVRRWLNNAEFDLFVVDYCEGNSNTRLLSNYYLERKGGKFQNLHFCYSQWKKVFSAYDAIMVMDDDIIICSTKLNNLFAILLQKKLSIIQPAFSVRGKISHEITKFHALSNLRKTNFVEVTCPIFKTSELTSFLDVFDPVANGGGVDFWFCHHVESRFDKPCIAIIDSIVCTNPHDINKGGTREIDMFLTREQRNQSWAITKKNNNLTFVEGNFKTYEVDKRLNIKQLTLWLIDRLLSNFGRVWRKIQTKL